MSTPRFSGVYTALVTPFTEAGAVDIDAYTALIDRQIAAGVAGVVVLGTTGESPTLTKEEKHALIELTVTRVAKRILVIVGTGSNSTAESVSATSHALAAGADACLLVNPYYNKPSQSGMIAHVTAVANVGLPVMLYNIPGRTGVNLTPASIATLSTLRNVVAVKEASGSCDAVSEIKAACALDVLSGDDSLTLPFMAVGASGVVSVLSNLIPDRVVALVNAAARGDYAAARAQHAALYPLFKSMFIETNPVPIKAAMAWMGMMASPAVRLPLAPMLPENEAKLKVVMQEAGLLPTAAGSSSS